jgi:hypothetical protein
MDMSALHGTQRVLDAAFLLTGGDALVMICRTAVVDGFMPSAVARLV